MKQKKHGTKKVHKQEYGDSKTIEVEATTTEEAIKKALKTLHATKQEVNIKVVKEEHKGLFGMEGADLAKIKVTLKSHK